MKRRTIPLLIFSFWAMSVIAQVKLPLFIADNMVLQQQTKVSIWGEAEANATISLKASWSDKTIETKVDKDGQWIVKVETPSAGGPYEMSINDGTEIILRNILIGEVWFCSGQSNMEMPMKGFEGQPVDEANEYIAKANSQRPIRMFTSANKHSKTRQEDIGGEWEMHTSEAVSKTSAVAYFYAQYLQETLNVPIGIIVSSWGGSTIEAWMDREIINSQFPEISTEHLDKDMKTELPAHKVASQLYNAKLHPFRHYTIKGFLWYQGESNRHKSEQYSKLLPAFVKQLRDIWNNEELPFYYVQIAPHKYDGSNKISSVEMRNSQMKCMKTIPNSGAVVTLDLGMENCIHPSQKKEVGYRLAYWALAKTYDRKGFGYSAPTYKDITIEEHKIRVNFDYYSSRSVSPINTQLKYFEIAGEDKIFYPAKAIVNNKGVLVESDKVTKPIAVRYAYRNYTEASLFDDFNLPVSSFRSDNWDN